jgi:hypothetical protein
MSSGRRTNDRRRRVLFSANQPETVRATAASRREVERLREARRPIAAYGSRVHRRLRARWFSLVPVRRRTLITLASVLMGIALLMSLAHYTSVAWPALAYKPEIARPLRIDRPDSFASWFTCLLLAACSGASLLIYQLRRYRSDDFQGRYRLWRLVLVVMVIASINSLVSLIDWSGAILDVAFGKRVALTGSDWIHLLVSIGGAVLALRLVAELRQCRFALGMMLFSCLMLAIPEAARWNVWELDTLGKWALATSAPLLAVTSMFVAFGAYLRMLYREVRQIEDGESLRERFQQMRLKIFGRSPDVDVTAAETEAEPEEREPKKRWWSKSTKKTEPLGHAQPEDAYEEEQNEEEEYEEEQEEEEEIVAEDEAEPVAKPKRRWFGLRSAKPVAEHAGPDEEVAAEETSEQPAVAKQKRGWFSRGKTAERESEAEPASKKESAASDEPPATKKSGGWFSMRLQPKAKVEEQATTSDEADEADEAEATDEEAPKRKRFGSGWFGGKKSQAEAASSESEAAEADDDGAGDEEYIDPDSIDWDTVSKAERRRLRKLIKRQGRAA